MQTQPQAASSVADSSATSSEYKPHQHQHQQQPVEREVVADEKSTLASCVPIASSELVPKREQASIVHALSSTSTVTMANEATSSSSNATAIDAMTKEQQQQAHTCAESKLAMIECGECGSFSHHDCIVEMKVNTSNNNNNSNTSSIKLCTTCFERATHYSHNETKRNNGSEFVEAGINALHLSTSESKSSTSNVQLAENTLIQQ